MSHTYKDTEFINSLSKDELIKYYECYLHHNHYRRRCACKDDLERVKDDSKCPCVCGLGAHFCTPTNRSLISKCDETSVRYCNRCCCQQQSDSFDSTSNESKPPSMIVCENYPASYTTRRDQVDHLKTQLTTMKKNKSFMKQTMRELDGLLNDLKEPDDGLDEVERFYRKSNKFIGSSMNITQLSKNKLPVPRKDINVGKHTIGVDIEKDPSLMSLYGNAVFDLRRVGKPKTFVDSELQAKLDLLKPKDPPPPKLPLDHPLVRFKSSIIYCKEK